MKVQLSLELLIYIALAGLSFLLALAAAEKVMHAYNIQGLLRFDCIAQLKNASFVSQLGSGLQFTCM